MQRAALSLGNAAKTRPGFLPLVLAFLYALLMVAVPWESVTGQEFLDKEVYLHTFEQGVPLAEEQGIQSVREFIFYEVLWDVSVRWVSEATGIEPRDVLLSVSFICFFIYAKYVFERHGVFLCILFLLNPILIDFAMAQLRMALAAALLLVALESKVFSWRISLVFLAFCIHTATAIFIMVYFVASWVGSLLADRRLSTDGAILLLIAFGLAIILAIGPIRPLILGYLGDRRQEYEPAASSLLYGTFWMAFIVFQVVQPKKYFLDKVNLYSLVMVSVFIFSIFFGVYGSRFIAVSFPLLLSSMLAVKKGQRPALLSLFALYQAVQWFYWTSQA